MNLKILKIVIILIVLISLDFHWRKLPKFVKYYFRTKRFVHMRELYGLG
jgi:hypothetical protein